MSFLTDRMTALLARGLLAIAAATAAVAWHADARADINADGKADLMWQDFDHGQISAWLLNGAAATGFPTLDWVCGLGDGCSARWHMVGPAGPSRLLWHNRGTGVLSYWLLNGAHVTGSLELSLTCNTQSNCANQWNAVATGNFHDGSSYAGGDVLWHNPSSGALSVWMVDGKSAEPLLIQHACDIGPGCPGWNVVGVSRHGKRSILWHNPASGELRYWYLADTPSVHPQTPGTFRSAYYTTVASVSLPLSWYCGPVYSCATLWRPIGVDDVNGDGQDDVLWFNRQTGVVSAWLMNGAVVKGSLELSTRCLPAAGCTSSFYPIGLMTGS